MREHKLLAALVAVNVIFLVSNIIFGVHFSQTNTHVTRESQKYPLLSKRIFAEDPNDLIINFVALRATLNTTLEPYGDTVRLYFEYLPSGISIGIHDDATTNIASLLKVPLVMATYKRFESGELTKDTLLTIRQEDLNDKFGDLWKQGAGAKISVWDAMRQAITKSDNTAANVLLHALPQKSLDDVVDYLDIPKAKEGNFIVISPKDFSSILRSLYLSAYLPKTSSSEILNLLAETNFNNQIAAGLPANTKIAHKIGEYTLPGTEHSTFSDCGIVYVPRRPYILCMMSSTSRETADDVMRAISEQVFHYVSTAK